MRENHAIKHYWVKFFLGIEPNFRRITNAALDFISWLMDDPVPVVSGMNLFQHYYEALVSY